MKKTIFGLLAMLLLLGAAGPSHAVDWGIRRANTNSGFGNGPGPQGPSNRCYGGIASSLISGGTDFSTVEATTTASGLLPYYVRAFDGSTTEYMRGSIILEPNLKLTSSATFYASIRPKTSAAGKNVQLVIKSTATATGGTVNFLVISTGADVVPLAATMHQWTVASWSQTIGNLGWGQSNIVDFGFSRGHDTGKLGATELAGDLYWKDWKVCVDLD